MKKTIKVNKELYNLKLAVVMHHTGESNAYTRESIARDACFVANNSIQYKCQQMLDVKEEIATLYFVLSEHFNINHRKRLASLRVHDFELTVAFE